MTIEHKFFEARNTPSNINEHLDVLRKYATECQHITELGVGYVTSTWAFLASKPKRLISYDANECPVDEAIQLARQEGIDFEFRKQNVLEVELEETDLLFIDTWHVYGQLKQEFLLHARKAKRYIILHDTTAFAYIGETPGHKGIWFAVREFLEDNPEWVLKERFTNNHGLAVLEKKESIFKWHV